MAEQQDNQLHQLLNRWSIYESYQVDQKTEYKDTIQKVCEFNSLEELAFLIKKTIYGTPTQLLSDPYEQRYRVFSRFNPKEPESEEGAEVILVALAIFKNNIHPSWEDPANFKQGEIQFEVKLDSLIKVDQIYLDLLYIAVGEDKDGSERINGIRVVDKIQAKNPNSNIRFEVWLDFDPNNDTPENKELKKKVEQIIFDIQNQHLSGINMKTVSHK